MSGKNDAEQFENLRKVLQIIYDNGLRLKAKNNVSGVIELLPLTFSRLHLIQFSCFIIIVEERGKVGMARARNKFI